MAKLKTSKSASGSRQEAGRSQSSQSQIATTAEAAALATAASAMAVGIAAAHEAEFNELASDHGRLGIENNAGMDAAERSVQETTADQPSEDQPPLEEATVAGIVLPAIAETEAGDETEPDATAIVPEARTPEDVASVTPEAVQQPLVQSVDHMLVEQIATQISEGVGRIVDAVSSGAIPDGFAQDLASDIIANVHDTLADLDVLPLNDLASNITSHVATATDTILGTVTSAVDPAQILDLLGGSALSSDLAVTSVVHDLPSIAGDLGSLPSSLLGGLDTADGGFLANVFYNDGEGSSLPMAPSTGGKMDGGIADAILQDAPNAALSFLGQPLQDDGHYGGMTQSPNALHLV